EQPWGAHRPLAAGKRQRPAAGIEEHAETFHLEDDEESPADDSKVGRQGRDPDGPDGSGQGRRSQREADELDGATTQRPHGAATSGRRLGAATSAYATTIPVNTHAPAAAV